MLSHGRLRSSSALPQRARCVEPRCQCQTLQSTTTHSLRRQKTQLKHLDENIRWCSGEPDNIGNFAKLSHDAVSVTTTAHKGQHLHQKLRRVRLRARDHDCLQQLAYVDLRGTGCRQQWQHCIEGARHRVVLGACICQGSVCCLQSSTKIIECSLFCWSCSASTIATLPLCSSTSCSKSRRCAACVATSACTVAACSAESDLIAAL